MDLKGRGSLCMICLIYLPIQTTDELIWRLFTERFKLLLISTIKRLNYSWDIMSSEILQMYWISSLSNIFLHKCQTPAEPLKHAGIRHKLQLVSFCWTNSKCRMAISCSQLFPRELETSDGASTGDISTPEIQPAHSPPPSPGSTGARSELTRVP